MKKSTLLIAALLLSFAINAQNLINYWNGYSASTGTYATGAGSQAKYWGWSTNPATAEANWGQANSGSIRYIDNQAGYDPGRIMFIRWDGSLNTSGKYYLKLDSINVNHLTGGNAYTFTFGYCWNSNGSAPTITANICAAKDGTGVITPLAVGGTNVTATGANVGFLCSPTSKSIRTGSITFMPPTDGDYYISFGSNTSSLCAIRDLSLVDNGNKYAGLIELQKQTDALTLGDVSAVSSDLILPTIAGTQGVAIKWASNNKGIIDSVGHVIQPAKYNKNVKLTATLSLAIADTVFTNKKDFIVTVLGVIPTPDEIAQWTFSTNNVTTSNDSVYVVDTKSGFKGTLMNDAKLRTIGKPVGAQYKVLDLGNGTGYFDMGKEIGNAIYALSDHTIMGYFRVNENYTNLAANGNYYWNFGNTDNISSSPIGFMYGRLSAQAVGLSAAGSPSTSAGAGAAAAKGAWHHFAYTLKGTTGTIFIDGTQVAQNTNMLIPSSTLPKDNLTGTPFNWLGRSSWTTDAYLKQTLLYDFRVMSIPLTGDDMNFGFDGFDPIGTTLDNLNAAYQADSNYVDPTLSAEKDNLTLGDLSAVTANLTLPIAGTLNSLVSISWSSSIPAYISSTGIVNRPNYFSTGLTLTATLKFNNDVLTKSFPATVVIAPGTEFTSDLIAKYDFTTVSGNAVTDMAEKHFTGTLMNNASIKTIGDDNTGKYKVLSLGDSIGYFDMGPEVGKVMYHLNDYTISAFYRVDTAYTKFSSAGNYLWNFSNSNNVGTDQNGYMIGALNNQSVSITPKYYSTASGNQTVSSATKALQGGWHHIAYTQNGTTGTIYVDGYPVITSATITNLPSTALPKPGFVGTPYNWIGRSCYSADAYLRKTLVYDFRVYKKALTDAEVSVDILNSVATVDKLNAAYAAGITALKNAVADSPYKVATSTGTIKLMGLNDTEKVSLFDLTGRKLKSGLNQHEFTVGAGVYIVNINGYTTKVIVK
jgi:hypothetical protein